MTDRVPPTDTQLAIVSQAACNFLGAFPTATIVTDPQIIDTSFAAITIRLVEEVRRLRHDLGVKNDTLKRRETEIEHLREDKTYLVQRANEFRDKVKKLASEI